MTMKNLGKFHDTNKTENSVTLKTPKIPRR